MTYRVTLVGRVCRASNKTILRINPLHIILSEIAMQVGYASNNLLVGSICILASLNVCESQRPSFADFCFVFVALKAGSCAQFLLH